MRYFSFGSLCCLFLLSFFKLFSSSICFYDIGSDGKVTLWERASRSVYNMFSVPCQVLTRALTCLNKGDIHNCRLYVTIEIDTRVCVQVVRTIRITEG